MKKSISIGLSGVVAALVVAGCGSGGGDIALDGDNLPAWTSSALEMNASNAALAIGEFILSDSAMQSPMDNTMPPLSSSQKSSTFTSSVNKIIDTLESKHMLDMRDADAKTASARAAGPSNVNEEYACSVSGSYTLVINESEVDGVLNGHGVETFNNCVDDGSIIEESYCHLFTREDDVGDLVTINGTCGGDWTESETIAREGGFYNNYAEVWLDTAREDLFTITATSSTTYTKRREETESVRTYVDEVQSDGFYNFDARQGLGGDAYFVYRNESKDFSLIDTRHRDIESGVYTDETYQRNGYVGSSYVGDLDDDPFGPFGYAFYFSNLLESDVTVDENITNTVLSGTFGSACLDGVVRFETTETLINDDNFEVCPGDDDAMPKDGTIVIHGTADAEVTFFEAVPDSNNSDMNITFDTNTTTYECWNKLPTCSELVEVAR